MPVLPAQLALLTGLAEPKGMAELAAENGLPYASAYKAVGELEKRGIVATHKEGKTLIVASRSPVVPSLARAVLSDFPRQDWGRVFHGDRPTFLRVLDEVGEPELAADVCGKSRSLAYHAIKTHAPRGLLVRKGKAYAINPRLGPLRELLVELDRVEAAKRLQELDPQARLLWSLGPEVLFASDAQRPPGGAQPAALSRFGEFGVSLVTRGMSYYSVAKRRLDAADAILQAMLVDPESRVNRSYCALVYEKAKPPELERKARIYGLVEEARALIRYVTTRGPVDGFLPWSEHERYRAQYGVDP